MSLAPPRQQRWRSGKQNSPPGRPSPCPLQLLVYSAFVCKLPFRAHLVVQTLNFVSLAVGPARSNFCASEVRESAARQAVQGLCGGRQRSCGVRSRSRPRLQAWLKAGASTCPPLLLSWPQLLSAPPADAILSKVHAAAAAIGGCLLPASAALSTYSTGASCHATLLFVWTVVGWLVPRWALAGTMNVGLEGMHAKPWMSQQACQSGPTGS